MEQLKQKSMKSALVGLLILSLLGIFLGGMGVYYALQSFREPTPLEDVDFSGDLQDLYVTGTIYFIYDAYAEETSGLTIKAYEYVIDADDTYYMGLRVNSENIEASEALLQASYNYLDGLDDGTELAKYGMEVTGLIHKMTDDSLKLYHNYLDYDNLEEAQQALFLPYYLEVGMKSRVDLGAAVIFIGIGAVLIALGIYSMIKAASGKNQKELYNYINASASPEAAKEKIRQFLASAPELHGLQYDNSFICGQNGVETIFGETDKLVWAYKSTYERKRNFVTISKTYSVNLVFTSKTLQTFNVDTENYADEILEQLQHLCPKAIFGYSEDLKKLYKKDFSAFMNLKYNVPQEQEG